MSVSHQFKKLYNVQEEAKASIAKNVVVGYQLMNESVLPFLKDQIPKFSPFL